MKSLYSTPVILDQSRGIYRALPLTINAMLMSQGIKLDWFDKNGKFIPLGRVKSQGGSGK
jgi:hypothetical protein